MTYLPGQAVVPCAICEKPIDRRGASGQGHRKWCSPECRREGSRIRDRERMGHQARRLDIHLCPRCKVNLRVLRPDGRKRGWCGPCEAAQKADYMRSPAGKLVVKRYALRHHEFKNPIVTPCPWCTRPVLRRGYQGSGTREYCTLECRTAAKRHREALRKART
jgi:endogenous inhibitor of DNA gyrase (YacG/DUF329 family)